MARVTVEDCLENVQNRFDLVIKAAKRARDLAMGVEATLPWENDKPTVMALREIAEGNLKEEVPMTPEMQARAAFGLAPEGEEITEASDEASASDAQVSEETPAASEDAGDAPEAPAASSDD